MILNWNGRHHLETYLPSVVAHTSSERSPWIVVNANKKREARLTTMLHLVRLLGKKKFEPLTGEDVTKTYSIRVGGVKFRGLTLRQLSVLEELKDQERYFIDLDDSSNNNE